MEACGPIAKLLSKQEAVKQILPIVQRLSEVRPAAYITLVKMRSQLWPCGKVASVAAQHRAICSDALRLHGPDDPA